MAVQVLPRPQACDDALTYEPATRRSTRNERGGTATLRAGRDSPAPCCWNARRFVPGRPGMWHFHFIRFTLLQGGGEQCKQSFRRWRTCVHAMAAFSTGTDCCAGVWPAARYHGSSSAPGNAPVIVRLGPCMEAERLVLSPCFALLLQPAARHARHLELCAGRGCWLAFAPIGVLRVPRRPEATGLRGQRPRVLSPDPAAARPRAADCRRWAGRDVAEVKKRARKQPGRPVLCVCCACCGRLQSALEGRGGTMAEVLRPACLADSTVICGRKCWALVACGLCSWVHAV